MAIQGHSRSRVLESVERRKGLSKVYNTIGLICEGSDDVAPTTFHLRKIRSSSADPYSAHHSPLPHISAGHVMQKIFYK